MGYMRTSLWGLYKKLCYSIIWLKIGNNLLYQTSAVLGKWVLGYMVNLIDGFYVDKATGLICKAENWDQVTTFSETHSKF
jgi:hypothetical protein